MKGLFVTIEGVDGAGKTTARDFILEKLKEHGIEFWQTREPGGTPIAERIRDHLKFGFQGIDPEEEDLTPMAEALLFNVARAQHIEYVIKPGIEKGLVVVSDRFVDSTYGHQGGGHGLDLGKLKALHEVAHDGFVPDLTILLDGDPVVFRKRLEAAGGNTDRLERNGLEWMQRSRNVHLAEAKSDPDRYFIVQAEESKEHVQGQLEAAVYVIVQMYRERQAA